MNDHGTQLAPRLLSLKEAAAHLAISQKAVERLIALGEIRATNVSMGKLRAHLRIADDDLRAWIDSRREEARA